MTMTANIRFYEFEYKDGYLNISHEITPQKDADGKVLSGTYKERKSSNWEVMDADLDKTYAVIRRRAVFSDISGSVTRYLTFLMPLIEFNEHKNKLRERKQYSLSHPFILLSYNFVGTIITEPNSSYRKTQHSTKKVNRRSHYCKSNRKTKNYTRSLRARK